MAAIYTGLSNERKQSANHKYDNAAANAGYTDVDDMLNKTLEADLDQHIKDCHAGVDGAAALKTEADKEPDVQAADLTPGTFDAL